MIKKMWNSIINRFFPSHRIVACPKCTTKLRFPIKKGKILRITCTHCKRCFEISFSNPITALVSGKVKWETLPKQEKRQLLFLGLSVFILIAWVLMMSLKSTPTTISFIETQLSHYCA